MGVSSVDELRQILGTDVDGIQKKKGKTRSTKTDDDAKDPREETADEIVYKDSSTFLKVRQPIPCLSTSFEQSNFVKFQLRVAL